MAGRVELSKAETEVARIVWELGTARLRDIVGAMPADRKIDPATVQTYLRRLKAKGYLRTRRVGRSDVYSPTVRQAGVVRTAVRQFVDRLFSGDALPLMQELLNDRQLSDEQFEQLQKLLDKHKAKRRES